MRSVGSGTGPVGPEGRHGGLPLRLPRGIRRRGGPPCPPSRSDRTGFRLLLAVILAIATSPILAQTTPVHVELTPAEITVGDRVTARLTLVWDGEPPADLPRFPDWQESWGRAEVLEVGEVEAYPDQAGRRVYVQTLVLTAFETGEIGLPRFTVNVPLDGKVVEVPARDGVRLQVASVLPAEREVEELEPRPPAPLVPLPGGRRFLWTMAALAGLCGLAAAALAWRLLAGVAAVPAVPAGALPPLEELMAAVTRIDPEAGSEPTHTAMSLALRRFLGRVLAFNAPERTTSEIQRRLVKSDLVPALGQGLVALLRDCDAVKFARLEVPVATTVRRLVELQQLARDVDAALHPPDPMARRAA